MSVESSAETISNLVSVKLAVSDHTKQGAVWSETPGIDGEIFYFPYTEGKGDLFFVGDDNCEIESERDSRFQFQTGVSTDEEDGVPIYYANITISSKPELSIGRYETTPALRINLARKGRSGKTVCQIFWCHYEFTGAQDCDVRGVHYNKGETQVLLEGNPPEWSGFLNVDGRFQDLSYAVWVKDL